MTSPSFFFGASDPWPRDLAAGAGRGIVALGTTVVACHRCAELHGLSVAAMQGMVVQQPRPSSQPLKKPMPKSVSSCFRGWSTVDDANSPHFLGFQLFDLLGEFAMGNLMV